MNKNRTFIAIFFDYLWYNLLNWNQQRDQTKYLGVIRL